MLITQNFIKNARTKLGLTQKELASRLDSKRDNIAKYETGRAIPPGDVILKIQELIEHANGTRTSKDRNPIV